MVNMKNFKNISVALLSVPLLSVSQMCGCGICAKAGDKVQNHVAQTVHHQPNSVELKISGMTCASCASHLHTVLSKTDGVISDEVKYPGNIALIKYNSSKVSISQIIKAIEGAGYKAEIEQKS
ncbi:MAG: hypothetical protein NVS3B19_03900 [Ginsengibacter sp.]